MARNTVATSVVTTHSEGFVDDDAVLDTAHVGDIRGALGTIPRGDVALRPSLSVKLKTLLAIVGPGLIVMVGDNDAGAFGTYTQAGQNYGTHLLWTLLLLVPVLYVNQEMVLRLGAVSGVGHARLILERFGKFWGAFSVIDLFILNALTIITEFIGVTLAVGYLGLPKLPSVALAGAVVVGAASTGSFRRFERVCLTLVAGSVVLVPIYLAVHPPATQMLHDFVVPGLPHGTSLSTVMLLIIAIVGTTVAPWQLFFQQSYVIDKRITPRFIKYERVDLSIGIVIVVVGAAAMFGFSDAIFAGRPGFGHFTTAAGVAQGLGQYVSRTMGDLFAIALLDASIIGAAAVGLATAYAGADVLGVNHSLHRPVTKAKGFYACYAGLMVLAGAVVLTPGASRAAYRRRPDTGRGFAAECNSLPAAAVQRQGSARPVGQLQEAQRLHRRRNRCSRGDVSDPYRQRPFPAGHERPDPGRDGGRSRVGHPGRPLPCCQGSPRCRADGTCRVAEKGNLAHAGA